MTDMTESTLQAKPKPQHHSQWPNWSTDQSGGKDQYRRQPLVNQRRLDQVVAIAGRTPFYVYDRSLISQRVSQLRRALPRDGWGAELMQTLRNAPGRRQGA